MVQCVFCDATSNLNTSLTVMLDDGNKIAVEICDLHAEDATVKTAKAAYLEKRRKIDEVLVQAKALGLNIAGMTQQGPLWVPEVTKPAPSPPREVPPTSEILNGDEVISTEIIDSRAGMVSVGGATDFGHIASHASHNFNGLQSRLAEDARKGKAKMVVVEGREGMPIAIPEKRVDGLGTTRLRIVKKENDGKLQQRFKKMAKDTIEHNRLPNFARSGYQNTQVTCPVCNGSCVIRQMVAGVVKETSCPKCDGAGVISVY
jgi:hypothetical protein